MSSEKSDILQGWKEIAGYVSRDERTVKRWEKQRGLPVRRIPGSGRANVYAVVSELDAWLSSSPAAIEAEIEGESTDALDAAERTGRQPGLAEPNALEKVVALGPSGGRDRPELWIVAVLLIAAALVVAGVALWRGGRRGPGVGQVGERTTQSRGVYPSGVAGVDELYLRGVYSYEQRTPESLNYALQCMLGAIAKDPKYAPAYAGLADTYNLLREYSAMPAMEAFTKARTAAETAIRLDPNLSQAHASLGFAEFFGYWQAADAEREFRTAIALDPNASLPHSWYGSMLTHEARYPEAIEQLDIAYRLQPASAAILSSRAFALGLGGHREEGVDLLQEMITQNRDVSSAHLRLAILCLIEPRDMPRNLESQRRYAEISHNKEELTFLEVAERAFRTGGEAAMWQATIAEERHRNPGKATWRVASAEAALGDKDAALADLEELRKAHDFNMIALEMNPLLRSLHSDSRFQRLEAEVGLPTAP